MTPDDFARPQDRRAHAAALSTALDDAERQALAKRVAVDGMVAGHQAGIYIEFVAPAGVELKLDSLELKSRGIRLLAVRQKPDGITATQTAAVFVPDGELGQFLTRIEQYANETTLKGQPKNKELVDRISTVGLATLRALWTDDPNGFPAEDESIWWEVWLRRSDGGEFDRFSQFCFRAGIEVGPRQLAFHDRLVCLARATAQRLSGSLVALGDLAELRRAKTSAQMFVDRPFAELGAAVTEFADRMTMPGPGCPSVCILDTGVTRAHPLIEPSLAVADATAVEDAWGSHDNGGGPGSAGHGTEMAGLALFGDLATVLASTQPVTLRHCLESVKILPPTGQNDPDLYGAVTAVAVSRPEIQEPERNRVFSMAVTAPAAADSGQPTSWSAAVDALAAGRAFDQNVSGLVYLDEEGEPDAQRLFVVSAGNVSPEKFTLQHLDRSDLELVQDPAQSWNALSVGAFTEKATIADAAYNAWAPVARSGDLSPWSTTSCSFESAWPNKPDVVFEGGNVAHDGIGGFDGGVADLCLLSTYFQPTVKPFILTNATSAAAAQVARMAAMIAVEYPDLWAETRRALIVHSARWTPRMKAAIDGAAGKTGIGALVRRYGFGVPSLARAIRSADDALTLVSESTIRPYANGKMREMHVHELPWPKDVLASLYSATVRLRVTLSYFIEPNPARLGWKRRHRYASHALRFDVKTASESIPEFRKRLNKKALEEDEGKPTTGSDSSEWLIGDRTRHRGSLHCDIWQGTAAALADRHVIGVYPVSGWWKDQPKRDRSEFGVRYALAVSIETDVEGVDIWTPVAQQIGIPISIEVD